MDIEFLRLYVALLCEARQSCVGRDGRFHSGKVDPEQLDDRFQQFITRLRVCRALGIDIRALPDALRRAFQTMERVSRREVEQRPTPAEFVGALNRLKEALEIAADRARAHQAHAA